MKICPTCKQTYEDHFRFCTNDGTSLGDRAAPVAMTSPDSTPKRADEAPAARSSLKVATVEAELILPEPVSSEPLDEPPPVRDEPVTAAAMPLAATLPATGSPTVEQASGAAEGGSVPHAPLAPDPGVGSAPQTEAEYQADLESISKLRAQFESSTSLPVIEPTDDDLRYLIKASRPRWIPWAFVGGALIALAVAAWLFLSSRNVPPPPQPGVFSGEKADPVGSGKVVQRAEANRATETQTDAALAVDTTPQQPDAAPDLSIDSTPDVASPDTAPAKATTDRSKAAVGVRDKPAVKRRAKRGKSRTRRATRRSRSKKRSVRRRTTRKRTRRTRKDTTIDPFAE